MFFNKEADLKYRKVPIIIPWSKRAHRKFFIYSRGQIGLLYSAGVGQNFSVAVQDVLIHQENYFL